MSRLEPLPIEIIEGNGSPVANSPFPALKGGVAAPAGISAAEIVGTTGAESGRMDHLEKMLQEAQGRTETVEREAYDKAYGAGEKAGLALGEKRAEQVIEAMEVCLKQVESEASRMRQSCVDAVVDIAQLVVEQLMGEILEQQKETLFKAAKRAAEQLPEVSQLKLAVHPDDIQSFERLLQEERPDWRLYADPTITQGTCRLVSKQQDALIDPARAIADSIQHIRVALHSGSIHSDRDEKDSNKPDES
ncbi:MAG: FliH/SctL family protein [Mariprofundaceae bacterium]